MQIGDNLENISFNFVLQINNPVQMAKIWNDSQILTFIEI